MSSKQFVNSLLASTASVPSPTGANTPLPASSRIPMSLDKTHMQRSEVLSRQLLENIKALSSGLSGVRQCVEKIDSIARKRLPNTFPGSAERHTNGDTPFSDATAAVLSPAASSKRYGGVVGGSTANHGIPFPNLSPSPDTAFKISTTPQRPEDAQPHVHFALSSVDDKEAIAPEVIRMHASADTATAIKKLLAFFAVKHNEIDEEDIKEAIASFQLGQEATNDVLCTVRNLAKHRTKSISPHAARTHSPLPEDFHHGPKDAVRGSSKQGAAARLTMRDSSDTSDDDDNNGDNRGAAKLAEDEDALEERAVGQAKRHSNPALSAELNDVATDGYDSAVDDDDDIDVSTQPSGMRRTGSTGKLAGSKALPSATSASAAASKEGSSAIRESRLAAPEARLEKPVAFTFTTYQEDPDAIYDDTGDEPDIPVEAIPVSAAAFRAAEEEAGDLKLMKAQLQAMRAAREAEKRAEGGSAAPEEDDSDVHGPWTIQDYTPAPQVLEWHGGDAEWPNCEDVEEDEGLHKARRFEAFNLRIVYEAGRTGFEEAKDFTAQVGTVIAGRYRVLDFLGSAAFSSAVACTDLHTGADVCLKIIKNNKDFVDQSLDEIKLLRYINAQDDADSHNVLRLYDYFYHKEHLFLVTELLKDNLYEFQRYLTEAGEPPYFTIARLQRISKQTLEALAFIHARGLIHCDLKPENILIKSYSRCDVKVIDFGSSCFVTDHLSSYIQSRSYRAPEVVLGLPYGPKIDIWSVGCILCELLTGNVLFANDSVQLILARMQSLLGPFPQEMLDKGREASKFFTAKGSVFERTETGNITLLNPKRTNLRIRLGTDDEDFLHFVASLLVLDPAKRPTAAQALQHPWLRKEYEFEPYVLPA